MPLRPRPKLRSLFLVFFLIAMLTGSNLFLSAGRATAQEQTQVADNVATGPRVVYRVDPTPNRRTIAPPEQYLQGGDPTASIEVSYKPEGGWPSEAQNAFQYAVDIWETQITSGVTIKVEAELKDLSSYGEGVLGAAGPATIHRDFTNAPQTNTWYAAATANKLAGSDLAPASDDISAAFNSVYPNWYFGTGATPVGKINFASVVLHEIGHGLGFLGSMNVVGGLGYYGQSGYPYIYDRFTENLAGTPLLAYTSGTVDLATQLTSNNIYFDGPNVNAANGGNRVGLYAPNPWKGGSSYSHLAESFNGSPHALMTYSISPGETIYSPGAVALCMFKDMGWTVATSCESFPATDFAFLPLIIRSTPVVELQNGNFESGPVIWSEYSLKGWDIIVPAPSPDLPITPHSGSWLAWLGGDNDEISYIAQTVTVPASKPYLTYWHWIGSGDLCGYDYAYIKVNGSNVQQYDLCSSTDTGGWVAKSINLSAYSGQTVQLQIRVETDIALSSSLLVDDVAFSASSLSIANQSQPADRRTTPDSKPDHLGKP